MIIPKKHKRWLTFKWNENTYIITSPENDRSIYTLFKQVNTNDYEQLGTGSNCKRLEDKVYEGKYK